MRCVSSPHRRLTAQLGSNQDNPNCACVCPLRVIAAVQVKRSILFNAHQFLLPDATSAFRQPVGDVAVSLAQQQGLHFIPVRRTATLTR